MTAEQVVSTYENILYRAALNLVRSPEDAEDLVQETFLRWITSRPVFESDEHEKAWLLRVLINLSRNLLNSAAHSRNAELLDIYPANTPEEEYMKEEISRLPEQQRLVVYLFYYEGYKTEEIAEMLGKKPATVRIWLHRARKTLKELLEEEA